ncbi:MAG TPA: cation:proton antiporter [Candidatus Binataceae bacterium]
MITHNILEDLALILCIAAVVTVIFHALHQPVVVGYLVAGMIVGPYTPYLLVDAHRIEILSELGVILLIFSIGLEFSLRRLARVAPTAGLITIVQVGLMMWIGDMVGQAFGFSALESLYLGAILSISSTTIVAKAFADEGVDREFSELVYGILLCEDLVAILLLAILTALSAGNSLTIGAIGITAGRLVAFLAILIVVGLIFVPRTIRAVANLGSQETLLIASIGICFAGALAAQRFGYSVALGAFLAGSLIAESGVSPRVERLVEPVRDMFAAVFFVSVGMLINPALSQGQWIAVMVVTLVVIIGKVVAVTLGAVLIGEGVPKSIRAGMSLAQIGEFSFIIASVGLTMKASREFIYTLAVAVSAITTFLTPFLIRSSAPFAAFIDRYMPRGLRLFTALYSSWIARFRAAPSADSSWSKVPGSVAWIALDVLAVAALAIAVTTREQDIYYFALSHTDLPGRWLDWILGAVIFAVAMPFFIGIVVRAWRIASLVALGAITGPRTDAGHLIDASRRILRAVVFSAILLIAGIPIFAFAQPLLPAYEGAALMGALAALLVLLLWHSVRGLREVVRSTAALLSLALDSSHPEEVHAEANVRKTLSDNDSENIPGIGRVLQFRIEPGLPGVGKTIGELHLTESTGAAVLAMSRDATQVMIPAATQELRAGDIIVLGGSDEAIAAAHTMLLGSRLSRPSHEDNRPPSRGPGDDTRPI